MVYKALIDLTEVDSSNHGIRYSMRTIVYIVMVIFHPDEQHKHTKTC